MTSKGSPTILRLGDPTTRDSSVSTPATAIRESPRAMTSSIYPSLTLLSSFSNSTNLSVNNSVIDVHLLNQSTLDQPQRPLVSPPYATHLIYLRDPSQSPYFINPKYHLDHSL